jgi:hypothetical protein
LQPPRIRLIQQRIEAAQADCVARSGNVKQTNGTGLSLQAGGKTFAIAMGCSPQRGKTGQVLVRTPAREKPVISTVEIGYAKRSEFGGEFRTASYV